MRGRKPRAVTVDPADVPALERVARAQSAPWFQVRRARAVLAVAGGDRVEAVAGRLGCDRGTVWRTCRLYEREGVPGLLAGPDRSGRPERLSPPGEGPDRPARLPGAGGPGAAHHPLGQRRPGPAGGGGRDRGRGRDRRPGRPPPPRRGRPAAPPHPLLADAAAGRPVQGPGGEGAVVLRERGPAG